MLLLAPAEGWRGLLPGQSRHGARACSLRPSAADLTVAVLRVRGAPRDVDGTAVVAVRRGRAAVGPAGRDGHASPPAEAGLLPGLAIGDTSALTPEVDDDFRAAGLTHLLAVSGANLAILTGAVLAGLRRLRADPRLVGGAWRARSSWASWCSPGRRRAWCGRR